jgi:hypothetical protein
MSRWIILALHMRRQRHAMRTKSALLKVGRVSSWWLMVVVGGGDNHGD